MLSIDIGDMLLEQRLVKSENNSPIVGNFSYVAIGLVVDKYDNDECPGYTYRTVKIYWLTNTRTTESKNPFYNFSNFSSQITEESESFVRQLVENNYATLYKAVKTK